jgi:hypothetical protein
MAPGSLPSGSPRSFSAAEGGGNSLEAAIHAHPGARLRRFETHHEQAAFTLALDVQYIPRSCPRKDYAPLGIRCRDRHGGIVLPKPRRAQFEAGGKGAEKGAPLAHLVPVRVATPQIYREGALLS